MAIKGENVYNALIAAHDALDRLRNVAESEKSPSLYACSQLAIMDLHDAAHDDGVIG